MQSGNVQRRDALIRTTQHQAQHDDQHRPESSGQKHHVPGVDLKSPKEMLGGNIHVLNMAAWMRCWRPIFAKPLQVESDSFTNLLLDFLDGASGGNTTGKVGNISRIVGMSLLNYDCVAHGIHPLRPACLRILLSVPGARSSLGLPGTVTRPALDGCLYWRWLPRVAARNQPSSSNSRSTSLTFMAQAYRGAGLPPNARIKRRRSRPLG